MPEPPQRPHPAGSQHRGFTLIELVVIIAILLMLTAMSAGPVLLRLRQAAVQGAAADIATAADTARLLARRSNGRADPSDDTHYFYGVRLADPVSGPAEVAVVRRSAAGTASVYEAEGEPVFQRTLPNSAILWDAEGDLQSGLGTVTWWYRPSSGTVIADVTKPHYISAVGLRQPELSNAFGLAYNTIASDETVFIAAGSATRAGLSVRTSSNDYAVEIAIFSSGVTVTRENPEPQ